MANAIGPDVSFYQDDPQTPQGIDFRKMAASAAYVIIRAGQNLWVDPDFKMNWREAKLANLPRGSYWFFDSRAEPKRQAELWVQQFGGDLGELPLFADFEEAYNGPFKGWRSWVTFLDRLKVLVGTKEIAIYTAYYYWRDNAPGAGTPNLEYFHQYPLWIANYGVTQPLIPRPWTSNEWLFWQYTEAGDGKLFGVESNGIDLNYFHGDLATFKARFNIPDTLPPPPVPDPGDPGTPTGKMYKVTATALKVRTGPGLSYDSIGLLSQNEVVEEIGASVDRSWLRVRRANGSLQGWSFAQYLERVDSTPPPPNPDPGDPGTPTGKLYKVTATALQVREGPGLDFNSIGLLSQNETVEEIGANADRSWLRIRKPDNSLRGWSFAAYLQSVDTPPPDGSTKNWYRVMLASLPIRETPNMGSKKLGILAKDDSIAAIDDTSNPDWVQVVRLDGLTGWCDEKFLEFRGTSRPTSYRQMLFTGVSYLRKELTEPRKLIVHVLSIDTQTAGLQFLVTPPDSDSGALCTRTTSRFLSQFSVHIAINGDGFSYFLPPPPSVTCTNGDPVKVNGYAVSQRKVYSPRKTADPIIYFNQRNMVTIDEPKGQVINAVSGDRLIVNKGKVVKNLPAGTPEPRTALGLNRGNRWLQLIVIDGRQPGISEGVTLAELADQMISVGVFTGVNMDGGSSSTMVVRGANGAPFIVNTPIEENIPGKESKVANHLGISLQFP